MFKPTHFRFDSAVMWPGAGPTTEISADHIYKVKDKGDTYTFVHSSGYAFQIDKSQVTPYGIWTSKEVPNMPTPEEYRDGIPSDSEGPLDTPPKTLDDTGSEGTVAPSSPEAEPPVDDEASTPAAFAAPESKDVADKSSEESSTEPTETPEPVATPSSDPLPPVIAGSDEDFKPVPITESDKADTSMVAPEVEPDAQPSNPPAVDDISPSGDDTDTAPTFVEDGFSMSGNNSDQVESGVENGLEASGENLFNPVVKAKRRTKKF